MATEISTLWIFRDFKKFLIKKYKLLLRPYKIFVNTTLLTVYKQLTNINHWGRQVLPETLWYIMGRLSKPNLSLTNHFRYDNNRQQKVMGKRSYRC